MLLHRHTLLPGSTQDIGEALPIVKVVDGPVDGDQPATTQDVTCQASTQAPAGARHLTVENDGSIPNGAFWRLTGYAATSFIGREAGDPELWADVGERNAAARLVRQYRA